MGMCVYECIGSGFKRSMYIPTQHHAFIRHISGAAILRPRAGGRGGQAAGGARLHGGCVLVWVVVCLWIRGWVGLIVSHPSM